MATCPQCRSEVGWRPIFLAYGLAGIVCPTCRASLEPEPRRFALLTFVSMLVGFAVLHALRGFGPLVAAVGMLAACVVVSYLLSDALVRLRPRRPAVPTIK